MYTDSSHVQETEERRDRKGSLSSDRCPFGQSQSMEENALKVQFVRACHGYHHRTTCVFMCVYIQPDGVLKLSVEYPAYLAPEAVDLFQRVLALLPHVCKCVCVLVYIVV